MDNKGHIIASLSKKREDVSVLVTEAIAIRALKMASDSNMNKIVIESDSQLVINSIRGLIRFQVNYQLCTDIVNLIRNF